MNLCCRCSEVKTPSLSIGTFGISVMFMWVVGGMNTVYREKLRLTCSYIYTFPPMFLHLYHLCTDESYFLEFQHQTAET